MTATEDGDIVDLIIGDHRDFEKTFAEFERGGQQPEYRRKLLDHLIAGLTRHAVAEEQLVYPTAADKADGGKEMVEHELEEHSGAEQRMKDLEDVEPTDPKFDELVAELIHDLRHHFEEEESKLLPALRAACGHDELVELGKGVELAKKVAPTRPHPSAPDTPPANLLINPGIGIIDRVRDALSGRAT
ncbi:MAG: hemerythrin domain-containing protein [Thermocrispum sp.]